MKALRKGLSICLFAHKEGKFLRDSYKSILKNIKILESLKDKIEYEIILIVDSPDNETLTIVTEFEKEGVLLEKVKNQDLGLNRNHAAKCASFDKIAFLDGDDIWDEKWLSQCLSQIGKGDKILHPEIVVFCGERNEIAICKSSNKSSTMKRIEKENLWVSSIFTRTSIVLENNFNEKRNVDLTDFEDWKWNRVTLKNGIKHKIVKKSYIYVYTRKDSLSQELIRERKTHES
jgi:glycosyltransferase involved in cell wall biosynthesis